MLFRILVCLLAFHAGSAVAQGALCEPYSNAVRLRFETQLIEPTYNTDLSIQDVRQLYTVRGQRISRAHENAIGLTYAEISLGLSASTRSLPRPGGGYCVYLEEVNAKFGLERLSVYLGREYPRGSCEFRTILDHENEHVAINLEVVKDYGPRLRQSLENELRRIAPLFAPSVNMGARRAVADLQQRVQPMMDALKQEQRRRNGAIDTDHNYGALQELCLEWDRYRVR